ncbi:MAG: hypothetical protein JWP57_1396 [Spirosoma sp.]|nr:hypothetical protein [Spirosoma sp.]
MESPNQDAQLNEQSTTFRPDTGGVMHIPDQNTMLTEAYNPSDLSSDANTLPTTPTDEEDAGMGNEKTGAISGSPNMEPDLTNYGNGDSLGNNDGTEPDPERTDAAQ